MRALLASVLTLLSKPAVALGGATIIAAVAVGVAWQSGTVVPSGQYAAAVMAPITAVGGANSDLSFQVSGQVAAIPVSLGQDVPAGATLVALDRSSLLAARAGSVANLEAQQAKLNALMAGTRPEQLAIDRTAVAQAQIALASALSAAYMNADDAIHAKADQVFTNPRNAAAQLSVLVPDSALVGRIQAQRVALEPLFVSWQAALASPTGDVENLAASSETNLKSVESFLNDLAAALAETQPGGSTPAAALTGYQTSANTGRLNVAAALSALISADTAYTAAVGALALAQAGATANDIAAQRAAVDAAQAAVSGIDVSLRQSMLVAPVAGTVTALNAHIGQTIVPGQALVSIESSGASKQDALVIPTSSVIKDAGQAFVYVKNGRDAPVRSLVTTGLASADGMTEIVSGLSAGQEVLTFGSGTQ